MLLQKWVEKQGEIRFEKSGEKRAKNRGGRSLGWGGVKGGGPMLKNLYEMVFTNFTRFV